MSTLDRQTDDAGAPRPAAHNAGSIPEHEAIAALGEYDRHAIGPRRTGGVYRSGCGGQTYRVDAVLTGTAARAEIPWSDYAIVEIDLDGDMPGLRRVHCTAWETWPGARVVSFPFEGDDLDPYLADVERVAQLYERRGAPDVANAWRQGAAMVTSGQMSYQGGGWRESCSPKTPRPQNDQADGTRSSGRVQIPFFRGNRPSWRGLLHRPSRRCSSNSSTSSKTWPQPR